MAAQPHHTFNMWFKIRCVSDMGAVCDSIGGTAASAAQPHVQATSHHGQVLESSEKILMHMKNLATSMASSCEDQCAVAHVCYNSAKLSVCGGSVACHVCVYCGVSGCRSLMVLRCSQWHNVCRGSVVMGPTHAQCCSGSATFQVSLSICIPVVGVDDLTRVATHRLPNAHVDRSNRGHCRCSRRRS